MAEAASGANILHLGSDGLKQLTLDVPPVDEQRRIADFLDDRVSTIDNVLVARDRQADLVQRELESELERLLCSPGLVRRPLQSLTDPRRPIQYGIVLPGPDFPGGVPIVKGGDIASGRLARMELNRTDPEIEIAYKRSRVRPGDLVIAIRGSFGELARVPDGLLTANLTQDSARIAPSGCDPDWLERVLETPSVQADLEKRVTGSTVRGINIAELRRLTVPVPTLNEQGVRGANAMVLKAQAETRLLGLKHSIELLTEYKQSLITAAVTGQFDVTTASTEVPA